MLLYFWMIIQIICESLPISSSGHVVLLQSIFAQGYGGQEIINMTQDFWAFDYLLQGVSAIIFLIYFFPYWWQLIVGKAIKVSSLCDTYLWFKTIPSVFLFGIVADGMTFLLWSCNIADRVQIPLSFGFLITAVALWNIQFMHVKKDLNVWAWQNGMIVGLMQGLALLPGISRFGITMATLQWLGYQGRLAFSISFLLQWPLIVAGSIKGFCSLHDVSILQTIWTVPFLMSIVITGFVGYLLLYGVGKIIDKNRLWKFSYYMIFPCIIALLV